MAQLSALTMPKVKRNDVPVKIDSEVVRVAKIVAASQDITLAEYLTERLRPLVEQDLKRFARQIAKSKDQAEE